MTSKETLSDILSHLPAGASHRAMMGEYVLYFRGKVVAGLFDDRLLVKRTPGVMALLPDAEEIVPYPGAKSMLYVERYDDEALLTAIFTAAANDLPDKKK